VKPAATLPSDARSEVRRIVLVSRIAGALVAVALVIAGLYLNRRAPGSAPAVFGYLSVAVGMIAFMGISTLARMGHARVLERTIEEVGKLTEQLRELAERDPLTGLYNLRAFNEVLQAEVAAAVQDGVAVSLVVADLDNFKLLNDSFGHQFGDEVLRAASNVFEAEGGHRSVAARLGGDEFALLLPECDRAEAVTVSRNIDDALAALDFGAGQPAPRGSFGVGTYPADGSTVQALFAAADGRMYSEKHRRKADTVSTLAGATRKLFVRAGRAMRPNQTTAHILQEIVAAARDELSLSLCAINISPRAHHPRVMAAAGVSTAIEAAFTEAAGRGGQSSPTLIPLLPTDAWVIETRVPDDGGDGGTLLLAGLPMASYRPDAPIVVALADLIQAVVANGRTHVDAVRAGRERDIHIDLAHALAGGGSLRERLSEVAQLIGEFVGASAVAIEGLDTDFHSMAGSSPETQHAWEAARGSDEWRRFVRLMARVAPRIVCEPQREPAMPAPQRAILSESGVRSSAVCPVRFGGAVLGTLTAVSETPDYFDEDLLAVLTTIADHLAPAITAALLRDELEASAAHLEQASRESLARLADAAEARDPHTGGHLRRIWHYSVALSLELGLSDEEARAIGQASAVHDLGKLRLSDEVLMRPGKLSEMDWEQMRAHPLDGERLIGDSPQFAVERAVARWHHERWDGTGYPDGLRGEDIPLAARIVAVADAFDALTTERPYKHAWTLEDASAEIERVKGELFCPRVVTALESLAHSGRLAEIFAEAGGDDAHTHASVDSERLAA